MQVTVGLQANVTAQLGHNILGLQLWVREAGLLFMNVKTNYSYKETLPCYLLKIHVEVLDFMTSFTAAQEGRVWCLLHSHPRQREMRCRRRTIDPKRLILASGKCMPGFTPGSRHPPQGSLALAELLQTQKQQDAATGNKASGSKHAPQSHFSVAGTSR